MHMSINKVLLQEYLDSEKAFKEAESKLAKSLKAEVKRLIEVKDTDGIHYMIDHLPSTFKPVRRLYEALLRIQEDK